MSDGYRHSVTSFEIACVHPTSLCGWSTVERTCFLDSNRGFNSVTWPSDAPPLADLSAAARDAAVGCVRLSSLFHRVGLESAWRFRPVEGQPFGRARVLLDGGDILVEVGFEVEDLAVASRDDEALNELAIQAIAEWRRKGPNEKR